MRGCRTRQPLSFTPRPNQRGGTTHGNKEKEQRQEEFSEELILFIREILFLEEIICKEILVREVIGKEEQLEEKQFEEVVHFAQVQSGRG